MSSEKNKVQVDWLFLVFLILFTNQMVLSLKIFGLVLIYLLRPNFKFGLTTGRIPKFYLFIIALAFVNLVFLIQEFSTEYIAAFLVGNAFWLFCFLGYHQCKLTIEKYGYNGVFATLKVFTALNFVFCIAQIVRIILITGKINPYTGLDFPYGVSTGDNIFGIFMQNSYYNMMVTAMLAVYFIFKRSIVYVVLSVTSLIMVFGNVGTVLFIAILLGLLAVGILSSIFRNEGADNFIKKILDQITPPGNFFLYIPALFLFIGGMYISISPENAEYIVNKVKTKVYTINTTEQNNYRTLISNQKMDPRAFAWNSEDLERTKKEEREKNKTYSYSEVKSMKAKDENTRLNAKKLMTDTYIDQLQGKTLSLLETWQFMKSGTSNFLFGAGTTRFSSLTAQKMAGFDSSRLFMQVLPRYTSSVFEENHKLILASRMKSKSEQYSSANWPDSFYNQILGEYGLLGVLLFLVFYIGFFVKKIHFWSYSFWLIILVIPFAHLVYMFETLCVMVFFELLIEADIQENKDKLMYAE